MNEEIEWPKRILITSMSGPTPDEVILWADLPDQPTWNTEKCADAQCIYVPEHLSKSEAQKSRTSALEEAAKRAEELAAMFNHSGFDDFAYWLRNHDSWPKEKGRA